MLRNCNIYVDLICGNHTPDFLIRAATPKSFSIFKILVLIFRSKKTPSCDQFYTFPSEVDSGGISRSIDLLRGQGSSHSYSVMG